MNGQESSSGYYHLMTEQVSYTEEDETTGDLHPTTRATALPTDGSSSTVQKAGSGGSCTAPQKGVIKGSHTPSSGSSEQESSLDQDQNRRSRVSFNDCVRDSAGAALVLNGPASHYDESNASTLLLEDTGESNPEEHAVRPPPSMPRKRPPPLQKLKSHLDLDELGKNEMELKANLYFHIGNPIKRWKIERVVPIKLILQLVKTFCLIVQVSLFTTTIPHQRAEFFYNSREVFENHFLLNASDRHTLVPRGIYTAFSIQELYSKFDNICERYFQLPNITIGGYDFRLVDGAPEPVTMTLRQYSHVELNASTFDYILNGTLRTVIFTVNSTQTARDEYEEHSDDRLFNRFFDLVVSFPVHNVRIVHRSRAECFNFTVRIFFMSEHDSGKVNYFLREEHDEVAMCNGTVIGGQRSLNIVVGFLTFVDALLIIMSVFSIFLIFSTLKRAVKLSRAMGNFYRDKLQIEIGLWERRSLFSGWHFLNFSSDLIIISGTAYKIALNFNAVVLASPTRVLLGTAIILQAGVMLRYVSYFKELNALNRTLYLAFPELLKFMLCTSLLFLAFSLTGYVVLGPFHPKFVTFYESFETLFGLLNGDDIYTTYDQIDIDDDPVAYIYSRIFLYAFLVLFIYFILNLFTSLVIAAYEASQKFDNATKNEVRRFVFSGPLTPNGVALRDVTLTKKYVDPQVILKRKNERKEPGLKKRTYSIVESLGTDA